MRPLMVLRGTRGEPLRRRRQLKTHRRWTWRSFLRPPLPQCLLLLVVLGALYALATSSVFAVTSVQIVGDRALPTPLLRQSCRCLGANIFLMRPEEIERRLQTIPYLDVRRVYARLPDRVVIEVRYRRPVALWMTHLPPAARIYAIDGAGTALYDIAHAPLPRWMIPTTATVPIVYSPEDRALMVGGQVGQAIAVQMVQQTQADLPADGQAPMATSVDRYRWSPYSAGLVAHNGRGGYWFALGITRDDELRRHIQAADAAYNNGYIAQAHCNYIDTGTLPRLHCRYDLGWHWPWGPGSLRSLPPLRGAKGAPIRRSR